VIEGVVGISPELELHVLSNREVLGNSQVQIGVARAPQIIAGAGLQPERAAVGKQSPRRVREQLHCPGGGIGVDMGSDGGFVAVEDRWNVVEEAQREGIGDGLEGETRVPIYDSGNLPAANQLVGPAGNAAAESLAASEGQLVDSGRANIVGNVEIRIAPADAQVGDIAYQSAREIA